MPIIRVEMFPGRTPEQKRAIAKELTDCFVRTAGGTPESVTILFSEIAKQDWANAGKLMSDKYPDTAG